MTVKTFKSYDEQLEILRKRGLVAEDGVVDVLRKENYYNVINGYKDVFIDASIPDETYKKDANFSEIYALYEFDRALRFILLKRLLKVETHIKSIVAYKFSERYGHDNYLKLENFDPHNNNGKKLHNTMQVISTFQRAISDQSGRHNAVTHYITEYGYVPLWVLVNVLTFGNISKFYGVLKLQDRQAIAKEFGIRENVLKSYLKVVSIFRNVCAHDERLYNTRLNALEIVAGPVHERLELGRDGNGKYLCGTKDVFALLICIKELLADNSEEVNTMILEINEEIAKLEKQIFTVPIMEILGMMGFPDNWRKL